MSASTSTARTGTEVISAVSDVAAHFHARRAETDAGRRIPLASMDELREAGMLRMLVPRARGGLELTIRNLVDATTAAARGCPSTGWCGGQMAFAALVFAASPIEVQEVVWARTPDIRTASTAQGLTAVPEPGGYVLSGRGAFASGIDHADWLYLGAPIIRDGQGPEMRFFILAKEKVQVLDTWETTAMRGTGSNTVVVQDVFVPEAFSVRHADLREGTTPGAAINTNPMYSLPWVTVVPLIYLSTMLGTVQVAYEAMVEALNSKRSPNGLRTADSEEVQLQVSFAGARIDAAQVLLHRLADRADAARTYTVKDRAMATRDASFATSQLVEAIDEVLAISGTGGFGDTSVIGQSWSDIHFASTHQSLSKRLAGSRFGRMELGIEDAVLPVFY